jgi:hypothetical protein
MQDRDTDVELSYLGYWLRSRGIPDSAVSHFAAIMRKPSEGAPFPSLRKAVRIFKVRRARPHDDPQL